MLRDSVSRLREGAIWRAKRSWRVQVRIPAKEIAHSDLMSIKIEASSR
jgi:hypothetical protein